MRQSELSHGSFDHRLAGTDVMSENPNSSPPAESDPSQPRFAWGCLKWFLLAGIGLVLLALFLPATRSAPEAARRTQCKNNLKQIGLALHNYHEEYGTFPPAYTVDAQGSPLHSWRTLILPYLDQLPLYKSIDLSRPWNDPVNAKASKTSLPIYRCPSTHSPANQTSFLVIIAPNGCFPGPASRSLSSITDDASETLMVLEVNDRSVPWMSPVDADQDTVLEFGPDNRHGHLGGFHALLCDGSVRFLSDNLRAATRQALISIADGDTVGDF